MSEVTSLTELNKQVKSWGIQNELTIDCNAFGKFDSEIAIIGNYVHEGEKLQTIPFVRGYGEVLWNAMRIEKINRSDVYQTIAIKKMKQSLDPKEGIKCSKEEIELYGALLRWEISQLPNLKYLIVLGDFALRCLTDLPSNMLCQGSVYDHYINKSNGDTIKCKLIVVIDPDTVLKNSKFKVTLENNLKRMTRVLNGTYAPPQITTIYNEKAGSVINYIRDLMRIKKPTALDIEVLKMETACIGLANKHNEALCINFVDDHGNRYDIEDELRIRTLLQHWFNRKDEFKAKLIMQNGMFDSYWLGYKDRMRLPPSHFDTMLASHTLASTMPHGLDYLVSVYTDMPYYKDQGKQWKDVKDFPAFWRYNGQDCCGTLAVFEKQEQELKDIILPDHFNKHYKFKTMNDFFQGHVMRLQPHLVRMTVGGIKADEPLKDQLGIDIQNDIDLLKIKIYAYIAELTGDVDYKPNLNSSQQLSELFFTKLRLVGRGQATDEDNRKRMINHPKTPEKAREMLISIDKYKKEQKFHSTYIGMKVDEDGRIRCEYKQTGVEKAPGRLSSTSVMWESGCLMPDAEVFTPNGWKLISDVQINDLIMQWDNFKLTFVPCTPYKTKYSGNMIESNSTNHKTRYTTAHRTLTISSKNNISELSAIELSEINSRILISGNYQEGKKHNPLRLRLLAMIQADACIEYTRVRILVKQQRKIDRIKLLLDQANIEYTTSSYDNGYTRYSFNSKEFLNDKLFTWDLLEYDIESLKAFFDELKYWDAHIRNESFAYYSAIKQNAEVVATIAHLVGWSSTLNFDSTNGNVGLYIVACKPREYAYTKPEHWSKIDSPEYVYCVTVPSSYFLVRDRGIIHITGNTNLQNQPPRAHELFECDEGYEFSYFDLKQAEAQVVGNRYAIQQWIKDFAEARKGSGFDAHRSLASMIYNIPYDQVPKEDVDHDGVFTIRYKSKRARHGFNYTMEPPTFAIQNELALEDATYLYNKYHRINPELKVGWEWSYEIIKREGVMFNAYGRRYTQLGRLDPKDLGNIVAFYFQSTIGDKVSRCIYQCEDDPEWPKDARMVLNIHDALIAMHRLEDGEVVRRIMNKYADEIVYVECIDKQIRELVIGADFKHSVPYKVKYVDNIKVITEDTHRWSNLEKIK